MTNRTRRGGLARANVRIGPGQRPGLGAFCALSSLGPAMPPPLTGRNNPRPHGLEPTCLWQLALALCVTLGGAGCFGGQTGTELTPKDESVTAPTGGGTNSEDSSDTDGRQPQGETGSVDVAGPSAGTLCDGSDAAMARLEADMAVSPQSLREFALQANPFTLFSSDGSTSVATLDLELGAACVRGLNEDRVLSSTLTLHVISLDSRFDFVLHGTALAYPHMPRGIGRVELDASVECPASSWEIPLSDCARLGMDLSGYESARLTTSVRIQAFGDSVQLLGALQVSGLSTDTCQEEDCVASTWVHVADAAMARTIP